MVMLGLLAVLLPLRDVRQRVQVFLDRMGLSQASLGGEPQHEEEAEQAFHGRDDSKGFMPLPVLGVCAGASACRANP